MFPRYFSGEITNWTRLPCYSLNLSRKSFTDVNEPRRINFRMITPKTTSIWFSHELCFGVYTNRMR